MLISSLNSLSISLIHKLKILLFWFSNVHIFLLFSHSICSSKIVKFTLFKLNLSSTISQILFFFNCVGIAFSFSCFRLYYYVFTYYIFKFFLQIWVWLLDFWFFFSDFIIKKNYFITKVNVLLLIIVIAFLLKHFFMCDIWFNVKMGK